MYHPWLMGVLFLALLGGELAPRFGRTPPSPNDGGGSAQAMDGTTSAPPPPR